MISLWDVEQILDRIVRVALRYQVKKVSKPIDSQGNSEDVWTIEPKE